MHGNLCPNTAVAKPAAIAPEVHHFEGTAICFDGLETIIEIVNDIVDHLSEDYNHVTRILVSLYYL